MPEQAALSEADRAAILAAASDYVESWLDGDAERMAGCLHPKLVKRALDHRVAGPAIDDMSRDDMVAATATGEGRKYDRPYDTTILDVFGDIATVRLISTPFVDYLHIARFDDRWLLVNVLWQRR